MTRGAKTVRHFHGEARANPQAASGATPGDLSRHTWRSRFRITGLNMSPSGVLCHETEVLGLQQVTNNLLCESSLIEKTLLHMEFDARTTDAPLFTSSHCRGGASSLFAHAAPGSGVP